MDTQRSDSFATLRVIAEHLRRVSFPNLQRPAVPAKAPATPELIGWATQLYCFSWMRHFCVLVNGIVTLSDAGDIPAARIVMRSVFELNAHAYYVKKHLKQHIDAGHFSAAWEFLRPIGAGSRYINKQHPEESEMFPSPPHIRKAINCFAERLNRAAFS